VNRQAIALPHLITQSHHSMSSLQISKPIRLPQRSTVLWLVLELFGLVLLLEFLTPADYVFGYLYIGPILLANSRLGRKATLIATLIAAILTLSNIWIPGSSIVRASTIADRLIAVLALLVTGLLSDRNRRYEEAIAQQQVQLQAQEQLASVRADFVSTLTHDLKTPLLGAIATLEALQQGQFGMILPDQQQVLATMNRSHQISLKLLETLLDVYRNDIEGLVLDLAPIDLVTIAEEVAGSLTHLALARQVFISINHGESDFRRSLWVNGDALQLQRVFANLITNAINHSFRGGRVEVVLESQSAYQVVKVLDSGAGITAEELPYLFERFYQGHSNRQARGSGLGLYLSRQIIEAHSGTIWAENRLTTGGSRQPLGALFGFRLPVAPHL
jgi:two-component system, NarL family, sensor kinase